MKLTEAMRIAWEAILKNKIRSVLTIDSLDFDNKAALFACNFHFRPTA